MSLQNKGGLKKFSFGFPSKKATTKPEQVEQVKRKANESVVEELAKKARSVAAFNDEDELLASAGIGKFNTFG